MLITSKLTITFMILIGFLDACRPMTSTAEVSQPVILDTPTAQDNPQTVSTATPKATAPIAGNFDTSALAFFFQDVTKHFTLQLLDMTNGASIAGIPPLEFGSVGLYSYLPGYKKLAMIVYPRLESPADPKLIVLDIAAWTTKEVLLPNSGWINSMAISPDGTKIVLASTGTNDNLALVLVDSMTVVATNKVPPAVRGIGFTHDSSALMVYTSHEDSKGISQGTPEALLMSATDLSSLWEVDLRGVRDGFAPGTNYQGDPYAPGSGTRYLPGVAFSPIRDELYVVHADEDRFSIVDFADRVTTTVWIHPKLTFLDRLMSFGAMVVYAKEQTGTQKVSAFSPDGKMLYITGLDLNFSQSSSGTWNLDQKTLGLKVVDPSTGTELLSLATEADQVAVMPNGLVLLRTWRNDQPGTDIFDPETQVIIRHFAGQFQNCLPLMNGDFVLAPSVNGSPAEQMPMHIYDPSSGQTVGSWTPLNSNLTWIASTP